jgi:REP element-mobilizing transposase RayT
MALRERVELFNIRLYLYCLMTNHFHLVFETPEGNCSAFMQALLTAYTVYFNRRHGRHGHVFDGRFKGKLVEGDDYLLNLSRYVHLNPVYVGDMKGKPIEEKVRYLRQYRWSTYRGYIGTVGKDDFVTHGPLLAQMRGAQREWSKRYRKFVEEGLIDGDDDFKAELEASPHCLGSEAFRAWVDEQYQKLVAKRGRSEDIAFRQTVEPLDPRLVLATLGDVLQVNVAEFSRRRRDAAWRAIAAEALMRFAGQTQREVAALLAMGSGSAVSKQLARQAERINGDSKLRRKVRQAEERLCALKQSRGHARAETVKS